MKDKNKKILISVGGLVLVLVLLAGPIIHIVKNHPYEYVYFNELAGGTEKAYGRYELDYYYHSTREASEWVIANAEAKADGSKIRVATWHTASVEYFFRNDTAKFQVCFARWYEKGNTDWDYAIFTVTGMSPQELANEKVFPPKNCVKTIDVDGKPICVVLKREDKNDFVGNQYKQRGSLDTAIYYFNKALAYDPYNISVLMNITESYFNLSQRINDRRFLDTAKIFIDKVLSFLPKYETANYFLAHYYMVSGNFDEAIKPCRYIIDSCNYKFKAAYSLMCQCYLQKNDTKNAQKTLERLIDIDQLDDQAVKQLIAIYMSQGKDERGAYRKLYKKCAQSFESRGKQEQADMYWDAYRQMR